MIYRAIVSAILRKANAFLSEVRGLVSKAETEVKRIDAEAKAEMRKVESKLVDEIAAL